MNVQNDIRMGVGAVTTPAIVISLRAHLLCSNREKPAFAYHSSRRVTSSLRSKVISALGACLLCSFRYAQSRKAGFRLRRGSLFPSTRARVYHCPVDWGEAPHPRLRSEHVFRSFRYAQSRKAGFHSMPGASLSPHVIRKGQSMAPI